ncbi:zinc finger protein 429-like [Ylistrum balloti]|uniref:zinc finger protein 429-like n=1 Tax=Ylistrum balloti TaxID=509963 RepID=UPI002905AEED|nr:zinc finger protein 429-like [Ylistrum balloti]
MSHDPEFVRMRQQTHLCHICGKRLLNSTELNIHLRSHFNILLDSCEICGKSFLRRSTLNRHVRTVHSKERSYKCEQCDKSYTGKCALQRHQRIHSDPSTHFSCTHCDKKFALKSVLVEHEMTHSPMQGKIFNCSICPAKFFKPYLLKQHMRIHTKEKPYICECGKSFSQKGNLNVHQKTHKGFKKFQCTQCDKGFTRVEYLLRHEEEKHSEEPGHLKKKIEQSSNIQTRSPSLDVKLASHNLKAKLSQTGNPPSKRKQSTKMVEANKISVIQTDEEPVKEEMSIEIKSFGEESLKEEMNIESKNCVKSTVEKTSTVKEEETTIDQWITGLN